MQNRIIKYIDKYYCIVLNLFYILFFSLITYFSLKEEIYAVIPILLIIILFFIFLTIIFYNYNIVFNYKDEIIKILKPGHFCPIKIRMNDIKIIKFYDVKAERKRVRLFHDVRLLYNFEPSYVYNNGKKYYIEIIKKNGQRIKIPYNSLYNCRSENTINSFEYKMNEIIKEFNDFKYNKYFKNN